MRSLCLICLCFLLGAIALSPQRAFAARDAAFLDPGAGSNKGTRSDEAIVVEPKADVDVGDTPTNVGRRATFFFVNQTNLPVQGVSMAANGDSNVRADIVSDDCSKEKKVLAGSRCSVTVEATPTGAGSWTAEVLMTHNAVGRIARARILGRTTATSTEKRDMGLSLNTKESKPVDFGDVEVGKGKAVRSALMINDSTEVISILSIEVIAAENGLQRLEQGCLPDMDLKMGESCPVTLLWKPEAKNNVSTDLIIRHTGRLGFAVIPIRGTAKEVVVKDAGEKGGSEASSSSNSGKGAVSSGPAKGGAGIPLSPTADELDGMLKAGKIPQISSDDLPANALAAKGEGVATSSAYSLDAFQLIGTVGNRAVIYKPDGATVILAVGEELDLGDHKVAKITNIGPREAVVLVDGKTKTMKLAMAKDLTQKAFSAQGERERNNSNNKSVTKASSSSSSSSRSSNSSEPNAVPLPIGK